MEAPFANKSRFWASVTSFFRSSNKSLLIPEGGSPSIGSSMGTDLAFVGDFISWSKKLG